MRRPRAFFEAWATRCRRIQILFGVAVDVISVDYGAFGRAVQD